MQDKSFFSESEIPFLSKAEQYCALGEQCRSSVMDKLTRWGAGHELAEKIVAHLVKNDFINESRFCHIYCESKLSLQKWGRIKIAYQLRAKRIDKHLIDEALKNLNSEQYHDVLMQLAQTKSRSIHEDDPLKHRAKLTSFLVSHGFESNEIANVINEISN